MAVTTASAVPAIQPGARTAAQPAGFTGDRRNAHGADGRLSRVTTAVEFMIRL